MVSVLVTGGTGFFGRGFVRHVLAEHLVDRVCIFSRDEAKQAQMRRDLADDLRCRWFVGDVRDLTRLARAMQDVEVVIHAAALKRVEVGEYDTEEVVKTNVIGAMNVIEAARLAGVKRVVALSTDKACAPANAYGASKLLAEKLFLGANRARGASGPRFSITRYGNVAGSTGSVIPTWRSLAASGAPTVPITDPECTRFFMTLDEAVRLVLTTANTMRGGELRIPELPAYRLGDLAEALGLKARVIGMGQGEKLHEAMDDGVTSDAARRMSVDELREALTSV